MINVTFELLPGLPIVNKSAMEKVETETETENEKLIEPEFVEIDEKFPKSVAFIIGNEFCER